MKKVIIVLSVVLVLAVGCASRIVTSPAQTSFTISDDLTYADATHKSMPEYPGWARCQGVHEATIILKFNVDSDGIVLPDIKVVKSTGYSDWDAEVIKTLARWRFKPEPGIDIRSATISLKFVLE